MSYFKNDFLKGGQSMFYYKVGIFFYGFILEYKMGGCETNTHYDTRVRLGNSIGVWVQKCSLWNFSPKPQYTGGGG